VPRDLELVADLVLAAFGRHPSIVR
jgi:hypothetical protein